MPRREIEGDWVMGWPDRKRPALIAGKDSQGRVINGRAPLVELEGLITPTDAYHVVSQLEFPEPIHPDDWTLTLGGEVARPIEFSLKELQKLPGRTVRAVTECAGNDAGFFDYLQKGGKKPSRINQQDMNQRAVMREQNALPSTDEIGNESTTTCAVSAGEFTGVPLAEVLKKAGLKPGAVSVRMEGFDRGQPDLAVQYRSVGRADFHLVDPGVINYEKGLPLAKALHPDTLLAWAMNGEYLLHVHGAPVRAVVPGWSGNWWVKWLQKIEVLDHMPECYYQKHYFVYGNSPEDPNKKMITAMGVRCIIIDPLDDRQAACDAVLISHNTMGSDLAPRLAFRLGTAVATGCVEVALSAGRFVLTRPCYGGNAREIVSFKTAPAIATVRPGCYDVLAHDSGRSGSVMPVQPEIDATAIRTRIVERKRDAAEGVRLEDAKVIVAGGRGLNGADGFRVLEKLAHTLGGAVGASRVPCDLGWCPRSWQIGLTGRTVTPDLYIAVGISGAGHHMAGCGNAKTIVAVNTDPEAAIFKDARYGVVGDYQRFIPAFISEVQKFRD